MDMLKKLRDRIDWLDTQIASLLNERMIHVKVEGEAYQLFALPFQLQHKTWWLGGLMPGDQYKKEKLQISIYQNCSCETLSRSRKNHKRNWVSDD